MPDPISTPGYFGLVHCERIVDGDSSTLTRVIVYEAGTDTEVTLGSGASLSITDVFIASETGGDIALVADSAAAGFHVVFGNLAASGELERHYVTPYRCPAGTVPKFSAAATGRNTCVLEGFIQGA